MAVTRWFTADLHLGHVNMATWRGFGGVDEMNEALIAAWRRAVSRGDEVYVLGDVAIGRREETVPVFAELPGTKYLVPGNHDNCGPWRSRSSQWLALYERYFEVLPLQVELRLSGQEVTLCHFPFASLDHSEAPRFLKYRPADRGQWLLHGHSHGHFGRLHHERQVDVGVDAWGWAPVSEEHLAVLMASARH